MEEFKIKDMIVMLLFGIDIIAMVIFSAVGFGFAMSQWFGLKIFVGALIGLGIHLLITIVGFCVIGKIEVEE